MLPLLIFDLDGTLVNSIDDLADAVNNSLGIMGQPIHDVEKYNYFVGDGVWELCQRALPTDYATKDNIATLHKLFNEYYEKNYMVNTRAYEGIKLLLNTLKDAKIKLAVASNKTHEFTVKIIKDIFGSDLFDVVLGSKDNVAKKPSPEILNIIINKIGINKEKTFMVGDTNIDILTAKNAGISSIGCLWGFRTREELEKAGADYIATDPMEILEIIKKEL